ncbi:hypothetical protein L3Q72_16660 [Vibrio sp. JC009]|uniref:flagellin N-terminal helical domain-containing protein n=1 Tax=Vibrio sp. JC009 TaxID=2912314 RepID=UPI0023B00E11|nr:flagellin [Vibrio sp. JC009]WED24507.1 hypothetical protein L3Q72_16660 [Vibrio sp. JC009]
MSLSVQSNTMALSAKRYLSSATHGLNSSMARLSSGSKINSARDDAAGLQISNRLNAQNHGLEVAMRNASDGVSTLQVADGALNEYTELVLRIRDLSLQAVNDSNSGDDVRAIETEIRTLADELNRIVFTSAFGGDALFSGPLSGDQERDKFEDKVVSFQIGAGSGEVVSCTLPNLNRLHEQKMISTSHSSNLGDPIPDNWRTEKGDYIDIRITDDDQEKVKRIEFSEGEPIEGVVNKINSNLNNKVRLYISKTTDQGGESNNIIGFSYEEGTKQSGTTLLGIEGQNFSSLKNSGGKGVIIESSDSSDIGESGVKRKFNDVLNGGDFGDTDAIENETDYINNRHSLIHFCDLVLTHVDSYRADIGASINRLEGSIKNLSTQNIHTSDSKSRIRDTDFAKETAKLTKEKILSDSTTSMLAQANNLPQSVSGLLAS